MRPARLSVSEAGHPRILKIGKLTNYLLARLCAPSHSATIVSGQSPCKHCQQGRTWLLSQSPQESRCITAAKSTREFADYRTAGRASGSAKPREQAVSSRSL
jgi:hypothetical protein